MWLPLLYLGLASIIGYPVKPFVMTKYNGLIAGSTEVSRGGRSYLSFRGIPYAEPPVGPLRFKNPVPITYPQSHILNATTDAPLCIQKNYFFERDPQVTGQEDCLYLNVYVPVTYKKDPLPVMVFIHYGGFFAGTGRSDVLGPEYFMDEDVILVTFNYRLGAFGFLTTLDDNAPGNLGMKDQVVVLKWVQENIGSFGGDKGLVTVFGASAGGGSSMLHLVSPAAKGLFHQLISQSGNALSLWARPVNLVQPSVLRNQSEFVGCGRYVGNNNKLIKCLQRVDADVLAASADRFKYFQIEPLVPYAIVTETKTKLNPEPYLEEDPAEILKRGDFERVPFIIGSVQDEGILRAASLLRQSNTREILNQQFDVLLPQMLYLPFSTLDTDALWRRMKDFYLNGANYVDVNNKDSVQGFIDMYSDRSFFYGKFQSINVLTRYSYYPLYIYEIAYRGAYTYGDLFALTNETIDFKWGTSHCDDLLYLFTSKKYFPNLRRSSDILLSRRLIKLWTTFAKTGVPGQNNVWPPVSTNWTPFTAPENITFLRITGSAKYNHVNFATRKGFHPNRMNFWLKQDVFENSIYS